MNQGLLYRYDLDSRVEEAQLLIPTYEGERILNTMISRAMKIMAPKEISGRFLKYITGRRFLYAEDLCFSCSSLTSSCNQDENLGNFLR